MIGRCKLGAGCTDKERVHGKAWDLHHPRFFRSVEWYHLHYGQGRRWSLNDSQYNWAMSESCRHVVMSAIISEYAKVQDNHNSPGSGFEIPANGDQPLAYALDRPWPCLVSFQDFRNRGRLGKNTSSTKDENYIAYFSSFHHKHSVYGTWSLSASLPLIQSDPRTRPVAFLGPDSRLQPYPMIHLLFKVLVVSTHHPVNYTLAASPITISVAFKRFVRISPGTPAVISPPTLISPSDTSLSRPIRLLHSVSRHRVRSTLFSESLSTSTVPDVLIDLLSLCKELQLFRLLLDYWSWSYESE